MIFAVFNLSLLAVCINCSFFAFHLNISYILSQSCSCCFLVCLVFIIASFFFSCFSSCIFPYHFSRTGPLHFQAGGCGRFILHCILFPDLWFAYVVLLMSLPPIIYYLIKIQNGLPFWCQHTQIVLERRTSNESSSSCCCFFWV